jgi:hypothetical protein
MARWLAVGICVLLLCGVVAAENLTVSISSPPNGQPMFLVGDTVTISGINLGSEITKIKLTDGGKGTSESFETPVREDKTWVYPFSGLPHGGYILTISNDIEYIQSGFTVAASLPKTPTPVPTTEPTPDYSAKIAQLEQKVAEQDIQIATLQKTPVPTIAEITAPTPSPTATPDYEVTIAAMQTKIVEQEIQIKEQGSWIDAILRFLGLK